MPPDRARSKTTKRVVTEKTRGGVKKEKLAGGHNRRPSGLRGERGTMSGLYRRKPSFPQENYPLGL